MTEKRNYNASLNARGLEAFVSEAQARRMCSSQGAHSLLIIDAHHGKLVTDEDGTQRIHLVADSVELVTDEHTERVQRFMRALYMARPDQYGQTAFETPTDGEVPLDAAAADLDALVETDGDGAVTGVWSDDSEAEVSAPAVIPQACAFPDCQLPDGHDGDHIAVAVEEEPDNVVEFSAP